jgi:Ni,Fe-hydrogenase III large subunit
VELAERVSGDTSVGHALAYCQALEAAAGVRLPARARYLRVLLLELERLYNHIGDFGAIANDTGFAVAHSHCFLIRERLLRLNKRLTGNRLLRGGLLPGGVRFDLPDDLDVAAEVEAAVRDFDEIVDISLKNTLLLDRLEGAGRLTTPTVSEHPKPARTEHGDVPSGVESQRWLAQYYTLLLNFAFWNLGRLPRALLRKVTL